MFERIKKANKDKWTWYWVLACIAYATWIAGMVFYYVIEGIVP